jgi:hypothetical protein
MGVFTGVSRNSGGNGRMVPREQATARLAADLIANYGDDAAFAAFERAEAMEKIGNAEAARV